MSYIACVRHLPGSYASPRPVSGLSLGLGEFAQFHNSGVRKVNVPTVAIDDNCAGFGAVRRGNTIVRSLNSLFRCLVHFSRGKYGSPRN